MTRQRTGILNAGKIIPNRRDLQQEVPPLPSSKPDFSFREVPDEFNPQKVVKIDSIPDLFKTIERMMMGLQRLNAEFCLKGDEVGTFWLVPAYTSERLTRNEVSFEDAAKLTVLVAAFGGKVVSMKFLVNQTE